MLEATESRLRGQPNSGLGRATKITCLRVRDRHNHVLTVFMTITYNSGFQSSQALALLAVNCEKECPRWETRETPETKLEGQRTRICFIFNSIWR